MPKKYRYNSVFNAAASSKVYHARLEDLRQFTPDNFHHLQRGGIRHGAGRDTLEMQQMLEKIPPSERAGINGEFAAQKVKEYLSDKDASHVTSHNQGGSGHPDNLKWENSSLNRARGDQNMTHQEQINLELKSQFDNLTGAVKAGVQAVPKGAVIGAVTVAPFAILSNGLRVVRGEISAQAAAIEVVKETGIGAGVGAGTAFCVTTVATACPPIAIALSAISPALWVMGGAGMIYQFFKILDDHKQQVKAYYESMTEEELQYLSQVEAELVYEYEKTISVLDEQRELTEVIVNRPRESGVENALQRCLESRQIYQSLQNSSSSSLPSTQQNFLPPVTE